MGSRDFPDQRGNHPALPARPGMSGPRPPARAPKRQAAAFSMSAAALKFAPEGSAPGGHAGIWWRSSRTMSSSEGRTPPAYHLGGGR